MLLPALTSASLVSPVTMAAIPLSCRAPLLCSNLEPPAPSVATKHLDTVCCSPRAPSCSATTRLWLRQASTPLWPHSRTRPSPAAFPMCRSAALLLLSGLPPSPRPPRSVPEPPWLLLFPYMREPRGPMLDPSSFLPSLLCCLAVAASHADALATVKVHLESA